MSRKQIYDDAADDSDKIFLVPVGINRHIHYGSVTLVTTADVGNRQMVIEIDDGTNVVFRSLAGAVQAASLTREYHFAANPVREAAFVGTQIMVPIPPKLILLPEWNMRLYDTAAIAATADDMTVSFMVTDLDIRLDNQESG